ncbi:MAG: c-type cytochrome domain-containing protein [Gemmataceae bacterium]
MLSAFLLAGSLVIGQAEGKKKELPPIEVVKIDHKSPVDFNKEIWPILEAKCAFCHSGNVKEGQYDMATSQALVKGGKRGVALVAGKPEESNIYMMSGRMKKPHMPLKSEEPFTPNELALVRLWIEQGAKMPTEQRQKPKVVISAPPKLVQPIHGVAVAPDKKTVFAAVANRIVEVDAKEGKVLRAFRDESLPAEKDPLKNPGHLSLIESMALSPDGLTLATGAYQEVSLWDVKTGKIKHRLKDFSERVVTLAFSANGKLLATGGGAPTDEGEVRLFDVATGKETLKLKAPHSDTVFGVSFSPDGKILATGGADKFLRTWELPSGKLLKSFEGHTHHVMDVSWKGDGKAIVTAGADQVLKVWSYENGEQIRTIPGHTKQITRVVFVGTKAEVLTCSGDQTVRTWNVDNGSTVRNFGGSTDFLYAVASSSDGALVASGGEEGTLRIYNGTNGNLIKSVPLK